MNCPKCSEPMKKVGWSISNNGKENDALKEYDKTTYHCEADDSWLVTELAVAK